MVASRGWHLSEAHIFTDNDTSAKDAKRSAASAWSALTRALKANEVDVVVGVDLDRLIRSVVDLGTLINLGASITLVDGDLDLTTADGRLRASVLTAAAAFEVERKSERQLRANEYRRSKGRPTPGRRRYGYDSDGTTPREPEAAIVRRMFAHVADGGSLRSLALALTSEGIDPAPGRSWSTGRVRYILTNPAYSGAITHKGAMIESDAVTPVVDSALAAEVRAVLSDEGRRTTPGPTPRHLGSGIAMCGANGCDGALMNLAGAYRCKLSSTHPTITKDRLDDRLRREVARAFLEVGDILNAPPGLSRLAPLTAALERNDAAASATAADRDEGLLSAAAARTRLLKLRDERETLEASIEAVRTERSTSSVVADVARTVLAMAPPTFEMSTYDAMVAEVAARFAEVDLDRQRETVRALLDVIVHPGRDPRRVVVWHRVALGLNPNMDSAHDAEGASRGPSDGATPRLLPRRARH